MVVCDLTTECGLDRHRPRGLCRAGRPMTVPAKANSEIMMRVVEMCPEHMTRYDVQWCGAVKVLKVCSGGDWIV